MDDYDSAINYPTKDGTHYQLAGAKIADLVERFPEIDVRRDLDLAWHWLTENADKRKPRSRTGWFVDSWLDRAKTAKLSPKELPPSHTPYRDKKAVTFLSMLKIRHGASALKKTDSQILIDHFRGELWLCRQSKIALNLQHMRDRLGRYLWLEAGVRKEEAEVLAAEALTRG